MIKLQQKNYCNLRTFPTLVLWCKQASQCEIEFLICFCFSFFQLFHQQNHHHHPIDAQNVYVAFYQHLWTEKVKWYWNKTRPNKVHSSLCLALAIYLGIVSWIHVCGFLDTHWWSRALANRLCVNAAFFEAEFRFLKWSGQVWWKIYLDLLLSTIVVLEIFSFSKLSWIWQRSSQCLWSFDVVSHFTDRHLRLTITSKPSANSINLVFATIWAFVLFFLVSVDRNSYDNHELFFSAEKLSA